MKCAKVRDMFSGYMENTLDSSSCVALEQHLAECPVCKADYDRFNAAIMMLEEMPEVDPPVGFHAKVMAGVERARRTTPQSVKWWRIDWQHVFTIRVPARAAAMGFAVLLMMAMVFQLTPVGTAVANFIGIQKAVEKTTGVEQDTVPPWQPWGEQDKHSMSKLGLSISVTVDSTGGQNVYALRIETDSSSPVKFAVDANGREFSGDVVADRGSVVRVPAAREMSIATVTWSYAAAEHAEQVFLPSEFNRRASSRRLSLTFENQSVRDILQTISERYGVVVLASGDLDRVVPYAAVESGNPDEALFHSVEDTGAGMKRQVLATSVYIVEPAR